MRLKLTAGNARRGHRKSRKGCVECKRRHIKCDESRPTCFNCKSGERHCEYHWHEDAPSPIPSGKGSASGGGSPISLPIEVKTSPNELIPLVTSDDNGDVNMMHMELLCHFSSDTFIPNAEEHLGNITELVIRAALGASYLMHAILALSARHLAFLNPEKKDIYFEHAIKLQTSAISIFNNNRRDVNRKNCVAMLLFTSVLGRHLFADAFLSRDPNCDAFLNRFIHYVRLHRGVKAIAEDARPFLNDTELRQALYWGSTIVESHTTGRQTQEICRLIDASEISPSSARACRHSIRLLQIGFDELPIAGSQQQRVQVVFWWPVLMTDDFVDLLARRSPEAIAILGYYAVLLDRAKHMWQINNAGKHLLEIVTRQLGDAWLPWLTWPHEMLSYSPDI